MTEGYPRFQPLIVGPAETPGMRQLKTDDQIVCGAVALAVGLYECGAQAGQIAFVGLGNDELMRVGAAIRTYRHGFSAANQFGAAFAEARPAPQHVVGNAARAGAVPPFHGLHRETVANALAVNQDVPDWPAQRRGCAGFNAIIARKAHAERGKVIAKIPNGLKRWHSDQ